MDENRISRAVAGSLLAGAGLSAVMLLGERLGGRPSELIELERSTANKLGMSISAAAALPNAGEQLVTHGGHLALSALAGLTYAALVDETNDGVESGAVFGFGFFIAAYGIVGPLIGVTPAPWRQPALRAVQHPVVHVLFGICTALFARRAVR